MNAPTPPVYSQVFSGHAPPLSNNQAMEIARKAYGIHATVQLLSSERDQNFKLQTIDGRAYVLKATHPAEDPAITDFQTRAQLHLQTTEAQQFIPHLYPSTDGHHQCTHYSATGERRAIRLIDFSPGIPLSQAPRSARQRQAIGVALASVDLGLQGFEHPMADHVLLWDIQHTDRIAHLVELIKAPERKRQAQRFLKHFLMHTQPALAGLRRQVIHSDLNPDNIMVDRQNSDRIDMLLDFGDMVRAPLVQDVSVACAYHLCDAANPLLEGVVPLLTGYHQRLALTTEEIALVPELIAARLLITVAITGWRAMQYPENQTYILRNHELAWRGLGLLDALPAAQAQDSLLQACEHARKSQP